MVVHCRSIKILPLQETCRVYIKLSQWAVAHPHYHLALLFDEMIQNNVHTGEGHFRCLNRVKDRHTQTGAWSSERLIAIPNHP